MAVKNNKRTMLTKRVLKETLMELMAEKPISRITIKEICEASDMSRSTFYLHYRDQFALLEDVENDVIEKIADNISKVDSEKHPLEAFELFLNYIKENKVVFVILFGRLKNAIFREVIMEKCSMNVPKIKDEKKDYYFRSFIIHGMFSVVADWIDNDFDMPSKDLAELLYSVGAGGNIE